MQRNRHRRRHPQDHVTALIPVAVAISVRRMALHHSRFVAPARAKPEIWRLILGTVVIGVSLIVGVAAVVIASYLLFGRAEGAIDWAHRALDPSDPGGTLALLFSFAGPLIGAMLAVRWFHKRPGRSLFGRGSRVLRDFVLSAATVSLLVLVNILVWSTSYDAVPNLDFSVWSALLPLTILGLLIQTASEEAVFRGYLQQQLAARFRARWVWFVIPSALFGLVHFNPETPPETTWLVIGTAFAFGLVAADLTARTGSLGAAWGFHFANNFFAVGILSTGGTITGLSRFRTPYSIEQSAKIDILILVDLAFLLVAWWLVRRVVDR